MDGQLQYKDKHGRVWVILESDISYNRWSGETRDQGHTDDFFHVATVLDDLIMVIDQEGYLSTSKPLAAIVTDEGAESVRPAPETIAEIQREAQTKCPTCGSPDPAAKPVIDTPDGLAFKCSDPWHNPTGD